MARAKHRDKLRYREFLSFVASCERAERHKELLKQHKEHAKNKKD